MNPFDMGIIGALLGGFQQKMEDMKAKMAETEVEGTAGGGLVRVVCTCDQSITAVHITEDAYGDRELLEDLVRAATNEALRKSKDEVQSQMSALTGGLPIPPGMIPGL
jgi:nucleoid-associated protein EbfC